MQHTPPHVCLYIQTKHLFTEQGTIEIQTPPYMEETYLWGELNTANHTDFNSTVGQILTIDPYIGRAFCRTPLIGGLARVQALVLPRDSINMEGPIFGWYHNTWGWLKMVLVPRMRLKLHVCAFVALIFFFTWSIRQSTFILVPCYGGAWDASRGTAKNQRAAHVDGAVGQIMKQHRRLQNWKAKHTHRERKKKTFQVFLFVQGFFLGKYQLMVNWL